jgi:hypothetical protein
MAWVSALPGSHEERTCLGPPVLLNETWYKLPSNRSASELSFFAVTRARSAGSPAQPTSTTSAAPTSPPPTSSCDWASGRWVVIDRTEAPEEIKRLNTPCRRALRLVKVCSRRLNELERHVTNIVGGRNNRNNIRRPPPSIRNVDGLVIVRSPARTDGLRTT